MDLHDDYDNELAPISAEDAETFGDGDTEAFDAPLADDWQGDTDFEKLSLESSKKFQDFLLSNQLLGTSSSEADPLLDDRKIRQQLKASAVSSAEYDYGGDNLLGYSAPIGGLGSSSGGADAFGLWGLGGLYPIAPLGAPATSAAATASAASVSSANANLAATAPSASTDASFLSSAPAGAETPNLLTALFAAGAATAAPLPVLKGTLTVAELEARVRASAEQTTAGAEATAAGAVPEPAQPEAAAIAPPSAATPAETAASSAPAAAPAKPSKYGPWDPPPPVHVYQPMHHRFYRPPQPQPHQLNSNYTGFDFAEANFDGLYTSAMAGLSSTAAMFPLPNARFDLMQREDMAMVLRTQLHHLQMSLADTYTDDYYNQMVQACRRAGPAAPVIDPRLSSLLLNSTPRPPGRARHGVGAAIKLPPQTLGTVSTLSLRRPRALLSEAATTGEKTSLLSDAAAPVSTVARNNLFESRVVPYLIEEAFSALIDLEDAEARLMAVTNFALPAGTPSPVPELRGKCDVLRANLAESLGLVEDGVAVPVTPGHTLLQFITFSKGCALAERCLTLPLSLPASPSADIHGGVIDVLLSDVRLWSSPPPPAPAAPQNSKTAAVSAEAKLARAVAAVVATSPLDRVTRWFALLVSGTNAADTLASLRTQVGVSVLSTALQRGSEHSRQLSRLMAQLRAQPHAHTPEALAMLSLYTQQMRDWQLVFDALMAQLKGHLTAYLGIAAAPAAETAAAETSADSSASSTATTTTTPPKGSPLGAAEQAPVKTFAALASGAGSDTCLSRAQWDIVAGLLWHCQRFNNKEQLDGLVAEVQDLWKLQRAHIPANQATWPAGLLYVATLCEPSIIAPPPVLPVPPVVPAVPAIPAAALRAPGHRHPQAPQPYPHHPQHPYAQRPPPQQYQHHPHQPAYAPHPAAMRGPPHHAPGAPRPALLPLPTPGHPHARS